METFPYQNSPYPPEPRIDISLDPNYTNEIDYSDALSRNRFNHSLDSGRSPRNQTARARSRLQTRTSPLPAVDIFSHSPEQQSVPLGPVSGLSAFPLPFRSQSTTRHTSSPTEYSSPAIPLTSQDVRSYYSPSFQPSPGRLFGFDDDLHPPTTSASLYDSQMLDSSIDTGYSRSHGSRDWQWPQSRSQNRRKYTPKRRRHDAPAKQRRWGPGHAYIHPQKRPPLFSTKVSGKRTHENEPSYPTAQRPRLVRGPLSSVPLDQDTFVSNGVDSTCVSQYMTPEDADDIVQPIRESKYWVQMRDDPIFTNLSNQSKSISIADLVKRRDRLLQDHAHVPVPVPVPVPRQTIMKEQGTQTDIELHPKCPLNAAAAGKDGIIMVLDSTQIKREQTPPQLLLPPPFQHQRSPREKPYDTQGNRRYQTASPIDPDTPRFHTPQPSRLNGLKRSRSETEDDDKRGGNHHRRRRSDMNSTPLSPPSSFDRRAQTPFYRR